MPVGSRFRLVPGLTYALLILVLWLLLWVASDLSWPLSLSVALCTVELGFRAVEWRKHVFDKRG